MRYTVDSLAEAIMLLTQPAIDRAMAFTRHPGLPEAWVSRSRELAELLILAERLDEYTSAARTVAQFAFQGYPPAVFWASDLGQLLYRRGGFPPRNPTKAEAARILRISHQAISDLIRRGRLVTDGPRVTKDSIAARMRPHFEEI